MGLFGNNDKVYGDIYTFIKDAVAKEHKEWIEKGVPQADFCNYVLRAKNPENIGRTLKESMPDIIKKLEREKYIDAKSITVKLLK